MLDSTSDYIMWLQCSKLSKNSKDDIILGIINQPLENSTYLIGDKIELMEVEITTMCISYEHVFILGDLNARTATAQDFTEADNFLFDYFE